MLRNTRLVKLILIIKNDVIKTAKDSHKPLSLSGWDRLIRQAFTAQILYNNYSDKYEKKE